MISVTLGTARDEQRVLATLLFSGPSNQSEIAEDLPEVRTAFLPVGGGGLLCGVASALKARLPDVRIVAVESESHPALRASLDADAPVSVPGAPTICDGVAVPYMTEAMFPVLRDLVDDAMVVPESEVAAAVRSLALNDNLVAEGAGALALAAALRVDPETRGTSVAPVTGGSIDPSKLVQILRA